VSTTQCCPPIHTTILRLCGFCYQKKHLPTYTYHAHQSSLICFIHLLWSVASSLFNQRASQSFSTISVQVFFGLPLGLAPSTSYSMHFFTQSLSSFRNTCPYHRNLFHCSTEIMSSNPSLSLNPLVGILSCSFTPHIHLTILISALWSASSFSSYRPDLHSMQHTTSHTTAVQSPYLWWQALAWNLAGGVANIPSRSFEILVVTPRAGKVVALNMTLGRLFGVKRWPIHH